MKILGIGVDIIQNKRIKNSIKNHNEKIESKYLREETLPKYFIFPNHFINLARQIT